MARKLTSREYFLVAVLAIAGVIALYTLRGGSLLGGGSGDDAGETISVGDAPDVHMERLAMAAETYDPAARNLFAYYTPPPKAAPRRVAPPPPAPVKRDLPPPPKKKVIPKAAPPSGPKPPPVRFTFIGYLGPKENKIGVFEQGEDMMLARSGEIVAGHFKVVDFKYETVVLGYVSDQWKDETTELEMKRR